MKRLSILLALFLVASSMFAQQITQQEVNQQLKDLPFESFAITIPTFPDLTYNIADRGSIGDGVFKNTEIINNAIQECFKAGGGQVIVPPGIYLTGPITMASHVNLHLDAGSVILFSADLEDYDLVYSSSGNASMPSLISGSDLEDVAITGEGVINGNGDKWRPIKQEKRTEKQWKALKKKGGEFSADGKIWFPRKGTQAAIELKKTLKTSKMTKEEWDKVRLILRSYTLNVENTNNMLVEGITLMNSPHITNMLRGIDGLVMHDVKILNEWWYQNADGLDISRCRNVLLYNCTVNTGDDGICMKSSGKKEGQFRLENIVIKDCKVYHGHGGFVVGSNTDGGMNNIYVKNLTCSLTDIGLRFKSDVTRGGKVTNLFIEDVYMTDLLGGAISFNLNYKDNAAIPVHADESKFLAPRFDGIHFKNIYCYGAEQACIIGGVDANLNVKNVSFENVLLQTKKGFEAIESEGVSLDNVQVMAEEGPAFLLKNTTHFSFQNMKAIDGKGVLVQGEETEGLTLGKSEMNIDNFEFLDGADPKSVVVK
ncbi:glycoside hydrolase family 28 protein [Mangrovibacterium lignilyticum]|uniref:glycoside hydrolase family 28 protein n=1 Tax=Mangrovibacterium lignilyticum TaxID=2668052 RepID=UPI0013D3D74B|nr:glycoside hydrolase family 28 protein [Mangrovibacterium lignilyticum]